MEEEEGEDLFSEGAKRIILLHMIAEPMNLFCGERLNDVSSVATYEGNSTGVLEERKSALNGRSHPSRSDGYI